MKKIEYRIKHLCFENLQKSKLFSNTLQSEFTGNNVWFFFIPILQDDSLAMKLSAFLNS